MIEGIVTLKEVLLHPIAVIRPYGLLKFCEVVIKGVSRRHYQFLQIVFSSRKPAIVRLFIPFFVLLMGLFGSVHPAFAEDSSLWSTASIAADLQKSYQARGITPDAVQQKTINGNDVYTIGGTDPVKNVRYNTAVFWRTGTKRAYNIEVVAPTDEFSSYEPAFQGMIQTVKLLP